MWDIRFRLPRQTRSWSGAGSGSWSVFTPGPYMVLDSQKAGTPLGMGLKAPRLHGVYLRISLASFLCMVRAIGVVTSLWVKDGRDVSFPWETESTTLWSSCQLVYPAWCVQYYFWQRVKSHDIRREPVKVTSPFVSSFWWENVDLGLKIRSEGNAYKNQSSVKYLCMSVLCSGKWMGSCSYLWRHCCAQQASVSPFPNSPGCRLRQAHLFRSSLIVDCAEWVDYRVHEITY